MDAKDLRNLLEKSNNKLSVFANAKTLSKYNFNVAELCSLVSDFLDDNEKYQLFIYPHFQKLSVSIRAQIAKLISNDNLKLQMLDNDAIIGDFPSYYTMPIIDGLSDSNKKQLLYNTKLLVKCKLDKSDIPEIIGSLSEETRKQVLSDKKLISYTLGISGFDITKLAITLSNEKDKLKIAEDYELSQYQKVQIISTISDKTKTSILLEKNNFNNYDIVSILTSMDSKALNDFLTNHKDFCIKNNIPLYKITSSLSAEKQKSFIENLENMQLTESEKKEILATLEQEVKDSIDTSAFPKEYIAALNMNSTQYVDKIDIDLNGNLEDYRGLDNLIAINPEQFTEEQKAKLMRLCDICPNMKIFNSLNSLCNTPQISSTLPNLDYASNVQDYINADKWITNLIDSIDSKYSDAQKIAIIDNAIGKKISYSPDFGTEVFDSDDCRAMWKIINSGYGVCNGISRVEQYILSKVGIKSEIIGTGTHAFLKFTDIEVPLANGEIVRGNTLLDPTWNLTAHRFGGRPFNFFVSYDEIRKHDIDANGVDHHSHENDDKLQDATLNLDVPSLRKLFTSVGLADKDGNFPIKDLLDKSQALHELYAKDNPEEDIIKHFSLIAEACPEFATCQNSTMSILSDLLSNDALDFDKCVINRVYNKSDEKQTPVVYVYVSSEKLGKKFYFADKDSGQFVELTPEEFTNTFECYEKDLEKHDGKRPWEYDEQENEQINLAASSGTVAKDELKQDKATLPNEKTPNENSYSNSKNEEKGEER